MKYYSTHVDVVFNVYIALSAYWSCTQCMLVIKHILNISILWR